VVENLQMADSLLAATKRCLSAYSVNNDDSKLDCLSCLKALLMKFFFLF
jgi:hypothetical protein